jgi:hypothetical protein
MTRGALAMAYDTQSLLKMSRAELDALFAASPAGPIPSGEANGTAIVAPGTTIGAELAEAIKLFAWKGKVFDPATMTLRNRLLPIDVHAFVAQVEEGLSWMDGKPCIVLDYSQTSVVLHWLRDEIRLVAPGLYLGKGYWTKRPIIDFALQFPVPTA